METLSSSTGLIDEADSSMPEDSHPLSSLCHRFRSHHFFLPQAQTYLSYWYRLFSFTIRIYTHYILNYVSACVIIRDLIWRTYMHMVIDSASVILFYFFHFAGGEEFVEDLSNIVRILLLLILFFFLLSFVFVMHYLVAEKTRKKKETETMEFRDLVLFLSFSQEN